MRPSTTASINEPVAASIGLAEHNQSTDTVLPARTVDDMHGDEKSKGELMILILRGQRGAREIKLSKDGSRKGLE